MNLELNEVVVQNFSDDAMEMAASVAHAATSVILPSITFPCH